MQVPLIPYLGAQPELVPARRATSRSPGSSQLAAVPPDRRRAVSVAGDALPTRGAIAAGRLPAVADAARDGRGATAGRRSPCSPPSPACSGSTPAFRGALTTSLIGVVICLSLVVLTGFVGQISLAQMTFAGIAAFVVVEAARRNTAGRSRWPIFAGSASVAALVAGMLVARSRRCACAASTWRSSRSRSRSPIDAAGLRRTRRERRPPAGAGRRRPDGSTRTRPSYARSSASRSATASCPTRLTAMFCLVAVVVLAYVVVVNLRRSATGRRMLAVRSNERAAAAAGVNVAGTKIARVRRCRRSSPASAAASSRYRFGGVDRRLLRRTCIARVLRVRLPRRHRERQRGVSGGLLVPGGIVFTILQNVVKRPDPSSR